MHVLWVNHGPKFSCSYSESCAIINQRKNLNLIFFNLSYNISSGHSQMCSLAPTKTQTLATMATKVEYEFKFCCCCCCFFLFRIHCTHVRYIPFMWFLFIILFRFGKRLTHHLETEIRQQQIVVCVHCIGTRRRIKKKNEEWL